MKNKSLCFVKEQRSFSWDWGPSFPTMGLWKQVCLVAFDDLHLTGLSSVPLYGGFSHIVFHCVVIYNPYCVLEI